MKLSDREFQMIAEYLHKTAGIHLTLQKKNLLLTRMGTWLEKKGFASFESYYEFLKKDVTGSELSEFINRISTNYTYFFREEEHFHFLNETVLKSIEASLRHQGDLRIWSAGCSNGAEPYTLAMIMADFFKESSTNMDKKILATDISAKVLEQAKQGIYEAKDLERMPNLWKIRYFDKVDRESFQVKSEIRKEVIFRRFNLLSPFPFKKRFHVIFCRNVMIYFDESTKNALINKFYNHLEPGGYLFVGHSETIDRSSVNFRYIMPSVYRRDEEDGNSQKNSRIDS